MQEHDDRYEIPMLSLAERDRRWAAVRERMADESLDCLLAHAGTGSLSALYLTQIDMEGLALFPADGEPIFLLPTDRWLHWVRRSQSWVADVRAVRDLPAAAAEILDEKDARRVGLIDIRAMGSAAREALMTAVSDSETTDASQLVYHLRLVKSDEEIAMMQRAAGIADTAIDALLATARAGAREHEVYAEVYRQLLAGGCEPTSGLSMESSPRPFHPVRKPSTRELREGDVIVAHINPRYRGYFGHPHICVTVGEPSHQVREMFEVCNEAFHTFLATAKPGAGLGDVCRETLGVIERAGFDWAKEPLTHSIGLAQQEPPVGGVPPDAYPDFELAENQTFGLHPWVGRMAEEFGIDSGRSVRITPSGAVPFGRPTLTLASV